MPGVAARLAAARSAVEQSCHLLLTPTPEVLERCSVALSTAIAELSDAREHIAPSENNSGILEQVRQIRSQLYLAGRLLETAAIYRSQWHAILVSMLEGYSPPGQSTVIARPGRMAVQG